MNITPKLMREAMHFESNMLWNKPPKVEKKSSISHKDSLCRAHIIGKINLKYQVLPAENVIFSIVIIININTINAIVMTQATPSAGHSRRRTFIILKQLLSSNKFMITRQNQR